MSGYAVAAEGAGRGAGTEAARAVVESARAGDQDAWRRLFDEHYPRLYRYFRSRVGSPEVAEDLASLVFVEAVRSLPRFRWRNRPFGAWLFGIARNRLLMHYRDRREHEPLGEGGDGGHTGNGVAPVRNEFLAVEVRDVLERLPAEYREAIEYRYVVGLSGVEAAAAMGRSHGSFRALLLRATRAFKREYGLEE